MGSMFDAQGPSDALAAGTLVRDYIIEDVLGQGGFGIVYRARHRELATEVALKEYFPSELAVRSGNGVRLRSTRYQSAFEDGLRRFREEALRLVEFETHPSIVSCRDFFRANETAYIVMEYVSGLPLSTLLHGRETQRHPLREHHLLAILMPLVEGLDRLHSAGVLHRDIKPSNILVRFADSVPVLIDFGAAKQGFAERTKSFAPFTNGYAALEQISEGDLGAWTDLYGIGALMWRIVAGGQPPWDPPNPAKVERRAAAILRGQVDPMPSASQLGSGRFRPELLEAIGRCLAVDDRDRYRDSKELLHVLNSGERASESAAIGRVLLLGGTQLHWEAWSGTAAGVTRLVKAGCDVNEVGPDGDTPLHWAAAAGDPQRVAALIAAGGSVDYCVGVSESPLERAARAGNTESVKALIAGGADVNRARGAVLGAAEEGQSKTVELLGSSGADLDEALRLAIQDDRVAAIGTLLRASANVDRALDHAIRLGSTASAAAAIAVRERADPRLIVDGETPLHGAAWHGDRTAVEDLLLAGHDANAKDTGNRSPLHWAAFSSAFEVVSSLLRAGSEANSQDTRGDTPLHDASASASADVIRALVAAGAPLGEVNRSGEAPLHVAVREGNLDAVRALLASGADANIRIRMPWSDQRLTPLHIAAREGKHEVIPALVDGGADLNARDTQVSVHPAFIRAPMLLRSLDTLDRSGHAGETPLRVAVGNCKLESVRALLKCGADLHASDISGETPLDLAARTSRPEIMAALLLAGPNLTVAVSKNGEGPLHIAAESGSNLLTSVILAAGAEVDSRDEHGRTPLHRAGASGTPEGITALVRAGAGVNASDENSRTPLHRAVATHVGNSDPLISAGAEVNARDQWGMTPLHIAAVDASPRVLLSLIAAGAQVNAKAANGRTPLHSAVQQQFSGLNEDVDDYDVGDEIEALEEMNDPWRSIERIAVLIESDAKVNNSDEQGETPLHLAARHGHSRIVSFLVDNGSNLSALNLRGETPLHASARGRLRSRQTLDGDLVDYVDQDARKTIANLISSGADLSVADNLGRTPLHVASRTSIPDRISALLESGADVNAKDKTGTTPLHLLVSQSQRCINRLIKSSDYEVDLETEYGNSDFISRGIGFIDDASQEAVSLLLNAGANVEATDNAGVTPLQCAALSGSYSCIRSLLSASPDVQVASKNGRTPLHFAAQRKMPDEIAQYAANLDIWTGEWFMSPNGAATRVSDLDGFATDGHPIETLE